MLVRRRGVLVRVTAMLMRRGCVFFRFSVPPMLMMVRGLAMMMRSAFVLRRRLVMMFAGRMLCFGHDVSSPCLLPSQGGTMQVGRRVARFNLGGIQATEMSALADKSSTSAGRRHPRF